MSKKNILFQEVGLESSTRENLIDELAAYSETDLLCYFAAEPKLYGRQRELWEPVLAWMEGEIGAPIARTQGIIPVDQPAALPALCRAWLEQMNDSALVATAQMVTALGSILLVFAILKGPMRLNQALDAAKLDEEFQQEQWGEDETKSKEVFEKEQKIRAAYDYLLTLGE